MGASCLYLDDSLYRCHLDAELFRHFDIVLFRESEFLHFLLMVLLCKLLGG